MEEEDKKVELATVEKPKEINEVNSVNNQYHFLQQQVQLR